MQNNKTIIKNYELDFGDLGIQIKFKDNLKKQEVRNLMYYFENYLNQLNVDYIICNNLFDIASKKTIDDIQN